MDHATQQLTCKQILARTRRMVATCCALRWKASKPLSKIAGRMASSAAFSAAKCKRNMRWTETMAFLVCKNCFRAAKRRAKHCITLAACAVHPTGMVLRHPHKDMRKTVHFHIPIHTEAHTHTCTLIQKLQAENTHAHMQRTHKKVQKHTQTRTHTHTHTGNKKKTHCRDKKKAKPRSPSTVPCLIC